MLKLNSLVCSMFRMLSVHRIQSQCASNDSRQSRMLQKLMTGKKKPFTKFNGMQQSSSPKPKSILAAERGPTKLSNRRTIVLNKMFMRHVTDLIASGPIGYELNGFGLQITQVKVCQQNYRGLNIFWTITNTDDFDYVEQKLATINKKLRHELHQMQLMGCIPHLTFVRDFRVSYFDELDSVIEKADYGDDFKPTLKRLRENDFEMQEEETEVASNTNEFSLQPMRHDVFGLNHAVIMGRVKQSMAKSKQAWKLFEEKQLNPFNANPFTFNTSFESIRQEQESTKLSGDVLKEFLQKRKLERKLKRAEQAEFTAQDIDEEGWVEQNTNHQDDDYNEQFDDENEVQKFYDELEPYEK